MGVMPGGTFWEIPSNSTWNTIGKRKHFKGITILLVMVSTKLQGFNPTLHVLNTLAFLN